MRTMEVFGRHKRNGTNSTLLSVLVRKQVVNGSVCMYVCMYDESRSDIDRHLEGHQFIETILRHGSNDMLTDAAQGVEYQ